MKQVLFASRVVAWGRQRVCFPAMHSHACLNHWGPLFGGHPRVWFYWSFCLLARTCVYTCMECKQTRAGNQGKSHTQYCDRIAQENFRQSLQGGSDGLPKAEDEAGHKKFLVMQTASDIPRSQRRSTRVPLLTIYGQLWRSLLSLCRCRQVWKGRRLR